MAKTFDSCVRKRNWAHYKTCNECTAKCTGRPNWFERAMESVMVWWYRVRINFHLKRVFGGTKLTKKQIRRISDKTKENMYPKLNSKK